jgi:transposase
MEVPRSAQLAAINCRRTPPRLGISCIRSHLSWAFIEAAHCAVRYDPSVRRLYQRKCAKGLSVVAIKAVAHKLARACYHVMREGVTYDGTRAFA